MAARETAREEQATRPVRFRSRDDNRSYRVCARPHGKRNNLPKALARWRMQALRPAARMTHPACRLAETSTPFEAGILRWRTSSRTQLLLQRNGPAGSVPCRSPSGPGAEPCSTCCIPASHARRTAFDPQGALVRQPCAVGGRAVAEQAIAPAHCLQRRAPVQGQSAAPRERYARGVRASCGQAGCVRDGSDRRTARYAPSACLMIARLRRATSHWGLRRNACS